MSKAVFRCMRAFSGFLSTDAGWQKPHFTAAGKAEMRNWIGL